MTSHSHTRVEPEKEAAKTRGIPLSKREGGGGYTPSSKREGGGGATHPPLLSKEKPLKFTSLLLSVSLSVCLSLSLSPSLSLSVCLFCLSVWPPVCLCACLAPRARFTFQASNSIAPLMFLSLLLSIPSFCLSVWQSVCYLSVCRPRTSKYTTVPQRRTETADQYMHPRLVQLVFCFLHKKVCVCVCVCVRACACM